MVAKVSRWIRFNLRYLGQPPWDTGVSPPELIDFLEDAPPGHALDLGCGTGTNLMTMASYGWSVVGVDLAWLSVLKARAKLNKAGVTGRVIHGDVSGRLKPEGAFDLVLDVGCYHSLGLGERAAYRQNLAGWLKPGRAYLLYAHFTTSPSDPHGVSEADFTHFTDFLTIEWRADQAEHRPDGSGGRLAAWARFKQENRE